MKVFSWRVFIVLLLLCLASRADMVAAGQQNRDFGQDNNRGRDDDNGRRGPPTHPVLTLKVVGAGSAGRTGAPGRIACTTRRARFPSTATRHRSRRR